METRSRTQRWTATSATKTADLHGLRSLAARKETPVPSSIRLLLIAALLACGVLADLYGLADGIGLKLF